MFSRLLGLLFSFLLPTYAYGHSTFALPLSDSTSKLNETQYLQSDQPKGHFSQEKWHDAQKGIVYEKAEERKTEISNPPNLNLPFSLESLKYVVLALVITALVVVCTLFLGKINWRKTAYKPSRNERIDVIPTKEEELLFMDLEPYIKEAIQNKLFSVAVRFSYLSVLQQLINARLLHWSKDQTNRHILYRVQGNSLFPVLQNIFTIYESAWFGQKPLNEESFRSFQSIHMEFLKQMEQQKK